MDNVDGLLARSRAISDLQVAPLRKLDDFLTDTSRFVLPDLKDLQKWNHRISSNLLYYQTNYFIAIIILFVIIGLCSPSKLVFGMLASAFAIALFIYFANQKPALSAFRQNHPVLSVIGVFIASYLVVWLFSSATVFLFATLFPVLLMFVHASLRQRNLKNKINEKLDAIGIKKTPMGLALDFIGQEFDKLE